MVLPRLARSGRSRSCWSPAACSASYLGSVSFLSAEQGVTVRSAEREIQELLEFRCVRRLRTVHALLQEANGLGLLADPLMEKATAEIVAGARARLDIQRDIKQKERAREVLVKKYKTGALPEVRSTGGTRLPFPCPVHFRCCIPAALQLLGGQGSLDLFMHMGPHEEEDRSMTICSMSH